MIGPTQILLAGMLALASTVTAQGEPGQLSAATAEAQKQSSSLDAAAPEETLNFDVSGAKFGIASLMHVLRDSKHEGWVLAAYPDPKTSRPLIGAGFSLDVQARYHLQSDPVNPHQFLEPSSVELWQAAGLSPERLQQILAQFDRNLAKWNKKNYRRKIKTHQLNPQVSDAEATRLLRVSAMQAVHNAKAYCRGFDQLTAAQQMALSQLVFQMGVNLEEFVQFLAALNGDPVLQDVALMEGEAESQSDRWKAVQATLIASQWARRYSSRAITVIAMFDATYEQDPKGAEQRIQAVLRPPAKHRKKKQRIEAAALKQSVGPAIAGGSTFECGIAQFRRV